MALCAVANACQGTGVRATLACAIRALSWSPVAVFGEPPPVLSEGLRAFITQSKHTVLELGGLQQSTSSSVVQVLGGGILQMAPLEAPQNTGVVCTSKHRRASLPDSALPAQISDRSMQCGDQHGCQGRVPTPEPEAPSTSGRTTNGDAPSTWLARPKSAKRHAAEALLAARYSTAQQHGGIGSLHSIPRTAAAGHLPQPHMCIPGRGLGPLTTASVAELLVGSFSAAWYSQRHGPVLAGPRQSPSTDLAPLGKTSTQQQRPQPPQHVPAAQQRHKRPAAAEGGAGASREQLHPSKRQQLGGSAGAVTMKQPQQPQPVPPLQPQQVQHVAPTTVPVAACPKTCTSLRAPGWCQFEVKLPNVNWQAVFDEPASMLQRVALGRGYEKVLLPEGLSAYVVDNAEHAEDAIKKLRASMQDRVLAIDLEWRPEYTAGQRSPVAVMQLASATACVILHTSAMGFRLPKAVSDLLADPSVIMLGFGWDSADETKMMSTFSIGKAKFQNFLDLQVVAHCLGYHSYGLARLTKQVLGVPLQKSKQVSRSNWAAPRLTPHQIKYAALDVFSAGQLLRGLRLWHSSPSPCSACRKPIGGMPAGKDEPLHCGTRGCTVVTHDLARHINHCQSTGHTATHDACDACGRVRALA